MSKNYAMVNGVKIDLPDDVDKLTFTRKPLEKKKKSPFERANNYESYFHITPWGKISETLEEGYDCDNEIFDVANYCTDKTMMEQRALHEILNRLLWRYSEEHGGDSEWNEENLHWSIICKCGIIIPVSANVVKENGVIYFKNKETAQSAIEEIVKPFMTEHPGFVW